MGDAPKSPIYRYNFHYKPSSYWGTPIYGNPHMSNGHGSWAFHHQNHRFQALSGVNPSSKFVCQYVSYRGPSSQIINIDGFPQLYTSITSGMFQQRLQYRLEES